MNNLLNQALGIIPKSSFSLERFSTTTTNDLGYVVNVYTTAETQSGIVEAVQNAAYQNLGLDFAKNYIEIWAETQMDGIDKQKAADRIVYNSKTFNVIKSNDWSTYNGWSSALAVEDKK